MHQSTALPEEIAPRGHRRPDRRSQRAGIALACLLLTGSALIPQAASAAHSAGLARWPGRGRDPPGRNPGARSPARRRARPATEPVQRRRRESRNERSLGTPRTSSDAPSDRRAADAGRPVGRSVLDSDLRHPRRDAAHRQGDVVVVPLRRRRAAREHGPGLALESGHGHLKSRRPPAGAGPRQPGADERGQHLVQRPGRCSPTGGSWSRAETSTTRPESRATTGRA